MSDYNFKKSVSQIVIERFLKEVDSKGYMPWQRPYERYTAFNYFTMNPYKGFNRLFLPFGEYITRNQIKKYNVSQGYIELDNRGRVKSISPKAYTFQKGIKWYPVIYSNKNECATTREEVMNLFPNVKIDLSQSYQFLGKGPDGYIYIVRSGGLLKTKSVLRFYEVADRLHFRNSYGEYLPSRLDTGDLYITSQKPKLVINNYIKRERIHLIDDYTGTPCYEVDTDTVKLNPHVKSEEHWFSQAFHELAHSTGNEKRLDRDSVRYVDKGDNRAVEECIAEICAYLCCSETGVYDFKTSYSSEYETNIAYIQFWKKKIIEWGSEFFYIVSEADKAFNYICDEPDGNIPNCDDCNEDDS